MHIAGGAAVAGLGGGSITSAAQAAAGAGISAAAAGKLNELSHDIAASSPTGNADADRALANIITNVIATSTGAVVGGSTGASTASNVDMFNGQNHRDKPDARPGHENTAGNDVTDTHLNILPTGGGPMSKDAQPDTYTLGGGPLPAAGVPKTDSVAKSGVPGSDFQPNANVSGPYVRPTGAGPTAAPRASVQGQPCVDCGAITSNQVADHKYPLVVQYYREESVDIGQQRTIDAVQPHCPSCSRHKAVS